MLYFKFVKAWFDFWIGFYWDRKQKVLYFLPIPFFGIAISRNPFLDLQLKDGRQVTADNCEHMHDLFKVDPFYSYVYCPLCGRYLEEQDTQMPLKIGVVQFVFNNYCQTCYRSKSEHESNYGSDHEFDRGTANESGHDREKFSIKVYSRSEFDLDGISCPECEFDVYPLAQTKKGSFLLQCKECKVIFKVR